MKLLPPLVTTEGTDKVAYVDPKSLSKANLTLVKKVDEGQEAEVKLMEHLHKTVVDSEFTSGELVTNEEKGSLIRIVTVEGVEREGEETSGSAIISESINGHLSEFMTKLNDDIIAKQDEANADD